MEKQCPYCGETQSALKNHVRLTDGEGHGQTGTYPDAFGGFDSVDRRDRNSESTAVEISEPNSPRESPDAHTDGGAAEKNVVPTKGASVNEDDSLGEEETSGQEVPTKESNGGGWLWVLGGLGVAAAASRYGRSEDRRGRM